MAEAQPNAAADGSSTNAGSNQANLDRRVRLGMNLSWFGNIALLILKIVAFVVSRSYSVLASTIDSLVDILSQILVALASHKSKKFHPQYPAGRSRLETMAVIGCAVIMACSTVIVIDECITTLVDGFKKGELPELDVSALTYCIIGAAIVGKLGLWLFCKTMQNQSPAMLALAQDHLNDVVSNVGAIITPTIAAQVPKVWWIDAVGGILISIYILWSWWSISKEQVDHIVGMAAPDEFYDEVERLVQEHHERVELDRLVAYHFGHRFIVEVDVVMDRDTPLHESHDISLDLQQRLEELDDVERAYVHVDYEKREELEHKVDRDLHAAHIAANKPAAPQQLGAPPAGHNNKRVDGDSDQAELGLTQRRTSDQQRPKLEQQFSSRRHQFHSGRRFWHRLFGKHPKELQSQGSLQRRYSSQRPNMSYQLSQRQQLSMVSQPSQQGSVIIHRDGDGHQQQVHPEEVQPELVPQSSQAVLVQVPIPQGPPAVQAGNGGVAVVADARSAGDNIA